jgi:hypothetical protein
MPQGHEKLPMLESLHFLSIAEARSLLGHPIWNLPKERLGLTTGPMKGWKPDGLV